MLALCVNQGWLDDLASEQILPALDSLAKQLTGEALTLDSPREQWIECLTPWKNRLNGNTQHE